MPGSLTSRYRRTGADVPFGDPRPSHGAEMEGYFWRFTDVGTGRVVVALCGVNQRAEGPWATVALAVHPGGFVRSAEVEGAEASAEHMEVRAGNGAFVATDRDLEVDLGPGARLSVHLDESVGWPHRFLHGGGLASVAPFLNQYWHPHVLGGRVSGTVRIGDEEHRLDDATVYCEKNWGAGFPPVWWWGQAQGFDRDDVCVAFSGGHLALGPVGVKVSGLVVRVGDDVVRLAPPTAWVRGGHDRDAGRWWVRGRDLRWSVLIEGDANGTEPHVLPVPLPSEGRNAPTDFEHLAGRMRVVVRRRGALVYEGTSELAGLEYGWAP